MLLIGEKMSQSNPLYIEKYLLSLYDCGCYISTENIVNIAQEMGLELPYKKRSLLLQTLLLHAKEHNQSHRLLDLLLTLLDQKSQELSKLLQNYPKTETLLQNFIFKINATQCFLQKELSLHVKENDAKS